MPAQETVSSQLLVVARSPTRAGVQLNQPAHANYWHREASDTKPPSPAPLVGYHLLPREESSSWARWEIKPRPDQAIFLGEMEDQARATVFRKRWGPGPRNSLFPPKKPAVPAERRCRQINSLHPSDPEQLAAPSFPCSRREAHPGLNTEPNSIRSFFPVSIVTKNLSGFCKKKN